ncbi:MAG: sigma-70 family RNA polymerase sigma factor [Puia sp.]|nr:sigma-70 family RNA polymerase sigma factor [Puia sp.]
MPLISPGDWEKFEQAVNDLRNGSEEGFTYIFRAFYNKMVTYSVLLLDEGQMAPRDYREFAKDIVSPIFHKVWSKRADFSSAGALVNYLVLSTKGSTLNFKRKGKLTINRHIEYIKGNSPEDSIISYDFDLEDGFKDANWQKTLLLFDIDKEIQKLPPQEQRLIDRRRKGLEMEEIATEFGISKQSAFNLQTRAIKRLQNGLSGSLSIAILYLATALR